MIALALRNPVKKLLLNTFAAAALWALASPVSALNLSEISLKSGLHQPFDATILLRNFDPVESDRVTVEIANDFIQSQYQGSNYLPTPLQATLINTKRGSFIKLTSATAIDEPFLKFAVQLSSPAGIILRQYEVLLDPPDSFYSQPKMAARAKLQSALRVTEAERQQGIELAQLPSTRALRPQPAVPAYNTTILSPVKHQNALRMEPVPLDRTNRSHSLAAEDRLFDHQEMNKAEFLAALDKYSLSNLLSPKPMVEPKKSVPVAAARTHKKPVTISPNPNVAALSAHSSEQAPAAVTEIPLATYLGSKSAEIEVDDLVFASNEADSVASALLAYRERARAGNTKGLNPKALINLSKNSVSRIQKK